MEKKKETYAFEFQEFIAINKIKVKKLPKLLRELVESTTVIESDAKLNCTAAHYKVVKGLLTSAANEIMDQFHELFEDKIKNNQIELEEKSEDKPDKKSDKKNEVPSFEKKLTEYLKTHDNNNVKTEVLEKMGLDITPIEKGRSGIVGNYLLYRYFATDVWVVYRQKGGNNE